MENADYAMVFVTTGTEAETDRIKDLLLDRHLAACVSIIPRINSTFWWNGNIESAAEFLLLIKTRTSLVHEIIQVVKENHSASVPEIIATPIIDGNPEYLSWIDAVTTVKE
jgi:periplasmic divalent cation tolerance protein